MKNEHLIQRDGTVNLQYTVAVRRMEDSLDIVLCLVTRSVSMAINWTQGNASERRSRPKGKWKDSRTGFTSIVSHWDSARSKKKF